MLIVSSDKRSHALPRGSSCLKMMIFCVLPYQKALPYHFLTLNGLIIVSFIFVLIGAPTGQPEHLSLIHI